jgi:hypothetical protein
MCKKFGFIKELNIKSIKGLIFKPVYAEEPTQTTTQGGEGSGESNKGETTEPSTTKGEGDSTQGSQENYQVNFEDLITKARKEEKDKLYPQIKDLKKANEDLTEKNNKNLLSVESKDKEIADLKAKIEELQTSTSKSDSDAVKTLKKEVKDLKATIADMETTKVNVEEIEGRIKDEYEVRLYREQKLREAGEGVIPELVTGLTKEDIDASVKASQERYQSIIKGVVSTAVNHMPVNNANTGKMSMADFKPEDIANMSPAEWAEKRKVLGLK